MRYRVLIVAAGLILSTLAGTAQERPATGYRAPRTPDGYPDLQGFWTNLTYTPFERPRELANKPFYTEQEAIDFFNRSIAGSQDQIVHYVNGDFGATPVQTGAKPNRRTSLVVDPADGRIPPLTPEAQKRQQALLAADKARGPLAQTWRDDRGTVWCVFHDRAVPAVVAPYGSNYHIVQSKDWIVMTYEWNTERRLIALDGRPHAPAAARTYAGDARGHWEGDTLVVETTNFSNKTSYRGSGENLHLVERFTRVGQNEIDYRVTITDPTTFTRPWTIAIPYLNVGEEMYEYACHEGNYGMEGILAGGREEERQAAEAAAKGK